MSLAGLALFVLGAWVFVGGVTLVGLVTPETHDERMARCRCHIEVLERDLGLGDPPRLYPRLRLVRSTGELEGAGRPS